MNASVRIRILITDLESNVFLDRKALSNLFVCSSEDQPLLTIERKEVFKPVYTPIGTVEKILSDDSMQSKKELCWMKNPLPQGHGTLTTDGHPGNTCLK